MQLCDFTSELNCKHSDESVTHDNTSQMSTIRRVHNIKLTGGPLGPGGPCIPG